MWIIDCSVDEIADDSISKHRWMLGNSVTTQAVPIGLMLLSNIFTIPGLELEPCQYWSAERQCLLSKHQRFWNKKKRLKNHTFPRPWNIPKKSTFESFQLLPAFFLALWAAFWAALFSCLLCLPPLESLQWLLTTDAIYTLSQLLSCVSAKVSCIYSAICFQLSLGSLWLSLPFVWCTRDLKRLSSSSVQTCLF